MSQFPPVIKNFLGKGDQRPGVYENLNDPAKLLVARTRYVRPTLTAGNLSFEWPLGVEGITISGQATLGEHKYIGDDDVALDVTHLDDQRVVLTGMFPGLTGTQNVQDLLKVIRAPQPATGKVLALPKVVFPIEIIVAVESYSFDHPEDDRNDSWTYTVTFRRTGLGKRITGRRTTKTTPVNPRSNKAKSQPKGKSSRVFTVHSGANTLRAVAQLVYGNPNRWRDIYNKNTKVLKSLGPLHTIPTKRLPLGLKLSY